MLTKFLPLQVNVGLFLFSKGDEIVDFTSQQAVEIAAFAVARYNLGRSFIEGLITEFEDSVFAMDNNFVAAKIEDCKADTDVAARIKDVGPEVLGEIIRLAKVDPQALRDAMAALEPEAPELVKGQPGVVSIPEDWTVSPQTFLPTSTAYHVPIGVERERYDELTGAGENEVVAVLDTGIDTNHPDFAGKILGVFSEVPGESGEDINGHGTHVSGTCFGPKEICLSHKAKGISIKVLGGRAGEGRSSWIESGLRRARLWRGPKGERVTSINMSIGGGGFHAGTERELELCEAAGIVIFAAAGNDGWRRGVDRVNWPSRSKYCQTVGAIDANENVATFTSGGELVDEASPGVVVVSSRVGGGRVGMSGTSMATPVSNSKGNSTQSFFVRNGFARIDGTLEYRPFIAEHARDIFDAGEDHATGSGTLDVYETLIEQSPDDVTLLASGLKSAVKIASAVFAFVLLSLAGVSHAQESVEIKTVTTTLEVTEVFVGGESIAKTEPTVVGKPVELVEMVPVVDVGEEVSFAFVIGTDLIQRRVEAIQPGKFAIKDPGQYLLFLEALPDSRLITVEPLVPDVEVESVAKLAKALADELNDTPTRLALATAYQGVVTKVEASPESYPDGGASESKTAAIAAIREVRRTNFESQRFDWVNGFQRPLQAELVRVGAESGEPYTAALKATVQGLRDGFTQKTFRRCTGTSCVLETYWVNE